MKHDRMLDVIGQIDDQLVYEAEHIRPEVTRRRPVWIRWAAAVTAFVFVAFIGFQMSRFWAPWGTQKSADASKEAAAEEAKAETSEAYEAATEEMTAEEEAPQAAEEYAAEEEAAEEEAIERQETKEFEKNDMVEEDEAVEKEEPAMFDEISLVTDGDLYMFSEDPEFVVDPSERLALDGTDQIWYHFIYGNSEIANVTLDGEQLTWDEEYIYLPEGTEKGDLIITIRWSSTYWASMPEETMELTVPLGEE